MPRCRAIEVTGSPASRRRRATASPGPGVPGPEHGLIQELIGQRSAFRAAFASRTTRRMRPSIIQVKESREGEGVRALLGPFEVRRNAQHSARGPA